jgi:hypothetical protein
MSDRKYRQHGYQDEPRRQKDQSKPAVPAGPREERIGPRTPNMPGFHEVIRCARCGNLVGGTDGPLCRRCGADLHSCAQCVHFDTGARFECTQPIPARVSPKDAHNECGFFTPKVTVERETGSTAPTSARKAFDDLFK